MSLASYQLLHSAIIFSLFLPRFSSLAGAKVQLFMNLRCVMALFSSLDGSFLDIYLQGKEFDYTNSSPNSIPISFLYFFIRADESSFLQIRRTLPVSATIKPSRLPITAT